MLKLKLQFFGHLMGRMGSLEKTLTLGKTEGKRRKGWQGMWGGMSVPWKASEFCCPDSGSFCIKTES